MELTGPRLVSWNEAARFVNWLNTSQGYAAAYKFVTTGVNDNISLWASGEAGYDASNPYRNSNAAYVLPSIDEWYKAAYYDPGVSGYRAYANSSSLPTAVASGTAAGTAVYSQSQSTGPADVTQAGGLSAYSVMAMDGNAEEWQETSTSLDNSSATTARVTRGGDWSNGSGQLGASNRSDINPTSASFNVGFRVVSLAAPVPEPSTFVLMSAVGVFSVACRLRKRLR